MVRISSDVFLSPFYIIFHCLYEMAIIKKHNILQRLWMRTILSQFSQKGPTLSFSIFPHNLCLPISNNDTDSCTIHAQYTNTFAKPVVILKSQFLIALIVQYSTTHSTNYVTIMSDMYFPQNNKQHKYSKHLIQMALAESYSKSKLQANLSSALNIRSSTMNMIAKHL
jgi:hypothetical protein